ncbi:FMN-dependent oxidoreductase (nitrilotriacetate monooxygenase family) [Sphingomonas vulcanisoli]|uniref:FMN-dependent oxidoreductase (Nitrilotriacetate monooxygenase family) n=1 Tax=Sphingomonas vulcanisoli TaxID=1658060 RepID=A0ABX0U149_9SPHN|nr:LLM class flavin-dependent oxidoreductase [Sphingomonas vulcanisoli]NIJ09626.1 FMN-dependent oxidoreductase (nitrilotriacetate monooxygenase family) [Sphingomonas vulcanisoli]
MASLESRTDKMKFAVFMSGDSNYHVAGWRHPEAAVDAGISLERWIRFARLLEDAKFDALFLADGPGIIGFDNKESLRGSSKSERFEPFTLLSALATVTTRLGLIATGTTTYNEPYNLARVVASLDLMSGGRAGWNVVTGGNAEDGKNFSLNTHVPSIERYARGEEFVDIALGLFDSIEPDAFVRDKVTGQYADPDKLHAIDHVGKYYSVKGPLSVLPSPQGRPIIVQAGQSEEGRALAARVADVIFTATFSFEAACAFYADLKARALAFGRPPEAVKIMPGVAITVGRTEAEVNEKEQQLNQFIDLDVALQYLRVFLGGIDLSQYPLDEPAPDFASNTARASSGATFNAIAQAERLTLRQLALRVAASRFHLALRGTPVQIADTLEKWFRGGAADGFNLLPNFVPGSIEDVAELLLPELRRRGLFREEYEGTTLRENLGLERPEVGWSRKA